MAIEPAEIEDDQGDGASPERTCVVTRRRLEPDELIRFVRAPDGTITPDLAHRLPGRGVWVGLSRDTVTAAAAGSAFARSLKRPVVVPEDLAGLVERLMVRRAQDALAIANKAGLVVAGYAKVESALASGKVALLVHAREAAADGRDKLDRKFAAVLRQQAEAKSAAATPAVDDEVNTDDPAPKGDPVDDLLVSELGSDELSLALGRQNVVHAALSRGGATQYFQCEVGRLRRYRSSSHPTAPRQ